ncbi:DNA polymerase [Ileibacterium valens]|uniref:DNA polymerase n=1 Tax=Ileibacterium valens TaxID=1862668 RepID=UPI00272C2FA8|nr:DNA polymerase [Ileibacterium valens]
MKSMTLDIETYSSVDLKKSGVYVYAESPDFEILLLSYSIDDGPVETVDLANGEMIPNEIIAAIQNPKVIKHAFNANFERVCLSFWINRTLFPEKTLPDVTFFLDPTGWHCDMVWAAYLSLPMSLEMAGKVLKVEQQKMKEGKDLIRYFCAPCKPTKSNGGRTRNLPEHDLNKWRIFKAYNKRDVETEIAIQKRLSKVPVPDFIWDEYVLDQQINDRGVLIDMELVENALKIDEHTRNKLLTEMSNLTMLENPNSVSQVKNWLTSKGFQVESLGKKEVLEMIKTAPEEIAKVLKLRLQVSKSSIKKYEAMKLGVNSDYRARGLFKYYGANRTGRFSGARIQLQNLKRNDIPDLAEARALVKAGNLEALELLYDSVPYVLSELIRTALIPRSGQKFVVADFSAIEARVLSWLAGEKWRMDTFASGGDIYCATASKMFHCNVVKHGENGELRQKGKQAELACGYGGSVGAMKAMGALEMGLQEEELKPLVDAWRNANPKIVEFWWQIDRIIKQVITYRKPITFKGMKFRFEMNMLFVDLPSGRSMVYIKPRIEDNDFGGDSITYMGIGGTKKWERIESYGPKFVENIVQAIARDLLAAAMLRMKDERIVAHVHDEMIIESKQQAETACRDMSIVPDWAKGLVLNADGYQCNFYKKD